MKKHEEAQIVNTKTGEVKDGYFIYVARTKAKIRNTRWMMTFQDSLADSKRPVPRYIALACKGWEVENKN